MTPTTAATTPRTADIAAALQGYDPQALHADAVTAFLQRLSSPSPKCSACRCPRRWAGCWPKT